MLSKSFSLAAVVGLAGSVLWVGCSSDDSKPNANVVDAGGSANGDSGSSDSGNGQNESDAGSKKDSGSFTGVDITYGKCPDFTKCGGDIVGSWKVSGGCVGDDAFAEALNCPGLQASDVAIKANGTVVATATTVERKINVQVSAKVAIPKTCAPAGFQNCAAIATGLQLGILPGVPKFDSATCTDAGSNCDCDIVATVNEETSDDYQASGGVLATTGNSGDRTFDYCVNGNKTTYKETTAPKEGEFRLPIIVEVTK